jgi:alkanesulfonate monooxygenase SsuD/methylene tetrahydromethanopterin reductase-like flavin-dependent oxidoreductase (luciferase family)
VGVGIGIGKPAWDDLGEESDPKTRGEMLDEGLEVLTNLWQAQPYSHEGKYYHIQQAHFTPGPVQKPRIPIWVAGIWPAKPPLRRMARWDGMYPLTFGATNLDEELRQLGEMITTVKTMRGERTDPFDVVLVGTTPGDNPVAAREILERYAAAGATWYLEDLSAERSFGPGQPPWTLEQRRARILAGPPRLS